MELRHWYLVTVRHQEIISRHQIEYVLREPDTEQKVNNIKGFIYKLDQKEVCVCRLIEVVSQGWLN